MGKVVMKILKFFGKLLWEDTFIFRYKNKLIPAVTAIVSILIIAILVSWTDGLPLGKSRLGFFDKYDDYFLISVLVIYLCYGIFFRKFIDFYFYICAVCMFFVSALRTVLIGLLSLIPFFIIFHFFDAVKLESLGAADRFLTSIFQNDYDWGVLYILLVKFLFSHYKQVVTVQQATVGNK